MRRIISIFIITVFYLGWGHIAAAQNLESNPAVRTELARMFSTLQKGRIETGYLRDMAFELVDFDDYDGVIRDTNSINIYTYEYLLRSLHSSKVTSHSSQPTPDEVMTLMSHEASNDTIPVSVSCFKYNYIVENALADSLITFSSGKVYDVFKNDGWQNPYGEKYLFGFAPYKAVLPAGNTTFLFDNRLLLSNIPVISFYFDDGLGGGYRRINRNDAIKVNYSPGQYILRIRVAAMGRSFEAYSKIFVSEPLQPGLNSSFDEDDFQFDSGEAYNGVKTKAHVFIKYASPDKRIRKPLFIVEGFDFKDPSDTVSFGFTTKDDYFDLDSLKNKSYDLIYVDWYDCTEYIQANANQLIALIEHINSLKQQSGSTEQNAVLGVSMGGLVARYALCKMEQDGKDHQTWVYISHDAPHLGANIPIGALQMAYALMSFMNGTTGMQNVTTPYVDEKIAMLKRYMFGHSTRQMLINSLDETGAINNSMHIAFREEMNSMGFPIGCNGRKCYNRCVTNGGLYSLDPTTTTLFNAHGYVLLFGALGLDALGLLYLTENPDLLYGLIPGFSETSGDILVYPFTSPGCKTFTASIDYKKHFLWIPNWTKTINIFSAESYAPNSAPIDSYSGSYYPLPMVELPEWSRLFLHYSYTPSFMFIPTASSLCYIGDGEMSDAAIFSYNHLQDPAILNALPFDGLHYNPADSSLAIHPKIIPDMFGWMLTRPKDYKIVGPSMPVNGSVFFIDPVPEYATINWSTSDSSIATIENGRITIKGNGYMNIHATIINDGNIYHDELRVLIGLPEYTLSTINSLIDKKVIVVASPIADTLGQVVFPNGITYEWYSPNVLGYETWVPAISASVSQGKVGYVYFRARYQNMVSPTYSIFVVGFPIEVPDQPGIILSVNDDGIIIDTGTNEELTQVKSSGGIHTFRYYDQAATFDTYPNAKDLVSAFIANQKFLEQLKTLKPWGVENSVVIELEYSNSSDEAQIFLLKFFHSSNL